MRKDNGSPDLDTNKAELFEAISHPVRIKILEALDEKPMGFAELGRTVGIESGGHLSFHLTKLRHLIRTNSQGDYVLTAEGRAALRTVQTTAESPTVSEVASRQTNRIAILPFSNMGPNPNDGYLADGLTEELINRISLVRGLEVIARTSVMGFKEKDKKISEIGKELRVSTLLEGSVRKVGKRIRVSAQLIDANTEGHLWSESYDRNLEDIFAVQSEIAVQVADALKVQLLPREKKAIEKKPTESTDAYGCFLRARELYREGSEASLGRAIELFEKAIKLDPTLASAYVGVAQCYHLLGLKGYEPWDAMVPTVRVPLGRALELDPDLAEAHASLALELFFEDDAIVAEVEAREALRLNPSLPDPYFTLAFLAGLKGEPDEWVRLLEAAYRLDPINPESIRELGFAYFWTGREHELRNHWRRTLQLAPAETYGLMTWYYLSKQDIEKAKECHAKLEKIEPTNPQVTVLRGVMDAQAGDQESALLAIKKIEESKMGPVSLDYIAHIYYALGDLDSFFEYENRAGDAHAWGLQLLYAPFFAGSRTDPRYQEMVERMIKMTGLTKVMGRYRDNLRV